MLLFSPVRRFSLRGGGACGERKLHVLFFPFGGPGTIVLGAAYRGRGVLPIGLKLPSFSRR